MDDDKVEVPAANDLVEADTFLLHLALRHRKLAERGVRRTWAHSADHHLHAAELDHIHPDLPTAEELAERAEIWAQRNEDLQAYKERVRERNHITQAKILSEQEIMRRLCQSREFLLLPDGGLMQVETRDGELVPLEVIGNGA